MIAARRLVTLLAVLLLSLVSTAAMAATAGAHAMSTSAVQLRLAERQVTGEIQLPIDRLAIAVDRDLTAASVAGADRAFLASYVAGHVAATGADGQRWAVTLGAASVRTIDGTPHLVYPLTIDPAGGAVTEFTLSYDVILEELLTHKALATVHYASAGAGAQATKTLGVFQFGTTSLSVPAASGSQDRGFVAAVRLGVDHVSSGADHLLFVLMLLVPAPLLAAGRRWQPGRSTKTSAMRVVHVVSAFAIGHSITLALAATGMIDLPSRAIEALIALSIAVSAVHAIRPLTQRGEVVIAAGFGLVHGLAFASVLTELELGRGSLVTTLLGFNVGIELTQLLVVALLMPSLLVLARTRVYPAVRTGLAAVGLLFATSWMLERAAITPADPFEGLQTWLVAHPAGVAAAFAAAALAAWRLAPRRSPLLDAGKGSRVLWPTRDLTT